MLGKTQHNVGNVSVVTLAAALQQQLAKLPSSSSSVSISGTALGARIDGPTNETTKAAAVALASRSAMAVVVMGDSEKSCGEWGDR
jgi:hypothetical protein